MRRVRPIVFPIGPSIAYVELTQEKWAVIDDADAYKVFGVNWNASCTKKGRTYYASSRMSGKPCRMHQLIAGFKAPDHHNGNGLDNRRNNLRAATPSENVQNYWRLRKEKLGGAAFSEKSLQKIREGQLGRQHTPETIEKMRRSQADIRRGIPWSTARRAAHDRSKAA